MTLFVIVLAVLILTFVIKSLFDTQGLDKRLPGPPLWARIPAYGHSYLLGKSPVTNLLKMSKKYGAVFRLDIGTIPTVWICNEKLIKEAIATGQLTNVAQHLLRGLEVIFGTDSKGELTVLSSMNGNTWMEQRKFVVHTFNDLGVYNKATLDAMVSQEVDFFDDVLHKASITRKPICLDSSLRKMTHNISWKMIMGKSLPEDKYEDIKDHVTQLRECGRPSTLLELIQLQSKAWAKFLTLFRRKSLAVQVGETREKLNQFFLQQSPDPNGFFLERYLDKIYSEQTKKGSSFYGEDGLHHLFGNTLGIFFAGTETTSVALTWFIFYVSLYPQVQEKLHKEIVDKFGHDEFISSRELDKLPYYQAVMQEVTRFMDASAFTTMRCPSDDICIGGFHLPKERCQVAFFRRAIYFDPDIYPNPAAFKPERFLTPEGEFILDDKILMFGKDKRKCPGERIARGELMVILTRIFRKYELSLESFPPDFSVIYGAPIRLKPFNIVVSERKTHLNI